MVKRSFLLAVIVVFLAAATLCSSLANAQNLVYTVNQEWAQLFINPDGTVDLT
jgi:hypothetical protein